MSRFCFGGRSLRNARGFDAGVLEEVLYETLVLVRVFIRARGFYQVDLFNTAAGPVACWAAECNAFMIEM